MSLFFKSSTNIIGQRDNIKLEKKITIIGGSGFVGTNLCRRLSLQQKNFEIIDLKMSNQFAEKCKIGDVRDIDSLRETITGNVVVNLAAVHRDNVSQRSEYDTTNIVGSENIAKICSEKGINKIVFTSTVAVYGFAKPGTDESGRINPFNDYGRSKFVAEEKLRDWQTEGENSLIIVRPTVIFGEGNRGNVFNLFNQIAAGKFLMVGDGLNKKSMAYIENVAAFLEACLEADITYGIFNYSDEPNLTMNELVSQVRWTLKRKDDVGLRLPYWLGLAIGFFADLIGNAFGKNLPVSAVRVRKFVSSTEFKSAKYTLDGFIPPVTLQEGISRTLKSEFLSPDPAREIFYTE